MLGSQLGLDEHGGLKGLGRGLPLLNSAQTRLNGLGQPFAGGAGQAFHGFLDPTIRTDPVTNGLKCGLLSQGQRRRVGRC
jgi:hypothetical protein